MASITIGMPSSLTQLLQPKFVTRILTLEVLDDFHKLHWNDKKRIIGRVMLVGLITLGIGVTSALVSKIFIAALPLCAIVAMGLSFTLLTPSPALIKEAVKQVKEVEQEKQEQALPLPALPAAKQGQPAQLASLPALPGSAQRPIYIRDPIGAVSNPIVIE